MRPLPIRLKLTAWYIAILLASLSVFGITAFFAMKKGIENTVDENLEEQAGGIEELMGRVLRREPERLPDELREHEELRAEDDFAQVSDQNGRWIYRSRRMASYNVLIPAEATRSPYNVRSSGLPLRALIRELNLGDNAYRIQVAAPMDDFYDALDRFKWIVLLLSPLLLVLASGGGYWLSRRALMPVDQITQAAKEINSNNLAKRLDVPRTGDELQRLSETLNGMLARLEASFNRITQFTADASHELRTPLALMRTTTEVSLRTSQTISDYRDAQNQVLEELEKTSGLVEKLMLLARADAGVETLRRAQVRLADCLQEACDGGRVLAEAKEITLKDNVSTPDLTVEGDSHALHRLFLILIDNAVKYSPSGGSIHVSLHIVGSDAGPAQFAELAIQDEGPGIPDGAQKRVFDRFYRLDEARSRDSGGFGLGLPIAKWAIEAHGGTIDVKPSLPTGAIFCIKLPIATETARQATTIPAT